MESSASLAAVSQELMKINVSINSQLPFWNQGQGGNISVKRESEMAIKPTGFRLDQITNFDDFAILDYRELASELQNLADSGSDAPTCESKYSELIAVAKTRANSKHRASMEVGFHIFLPKSFVCHIHHLNSLLLTELMDQKNADEFLKKWDSKITQVPYIRPGWELTQYFIQNKIASPIILMRNHGVIFQMNKIEEFDLFIEFSTQLEKFLSEKLGKDINQFGRRLLNSELEAPFRFYFPDVAIFEDKLKSFLQKESDGNFLLAHGNEIPQDMYENWFAIVYLYSLMPELKTLSSSEVQELKSTPTEIARLREILKGAKS